MLEWCKETNLSLSHEKFHMLQTEGTILDHHISAKGIKVDPDKIDVIVNLSAPKSQKEVIIFLVHASYPC